MADIKHDNVLVDWASSDDDTETVTNVALVDFDIAIPLKAGESRQTPYAIGNVMWRSPEGQTARGVTRASDIFSFGLVVSKALFDIQEVYAKLCLQCIYGVGGTDYLLLDDYKELEEEQITAEQEVLTRHFCYFGPATQGLLKQVGDENWRRALTGASAMANESVKENPQLKSEYRGKVLGPQAQDIISRMKNPDPKVRPTIEQVMEHPWWQQD